MPYHSSVKFKIKQLFRRGKIDKVTVGIDSEQPIGYSCNHGPKTLLAFL